MRIAYVCADPGVPVFGNKGSSVHVMEMLAALQQVNASVRIDLFAMRFDADLPAHLADVCVHTLPPPPKGADAREAACIAGNATLREMLLAHGPFDLIYERYSLWSHAAVDVAHETAATHILEVNAPLIEEQAAHRVLIRRAQAEEIARHVFCRSHAVVAVSDVVANYVSRVSGRPIGAGVYALPNGVNIDRFTPALTRMQSDVEAVTVGFVGTLKPWHGLGVLAEAFVRLHERTPQVRLLMIGDGPMRAELEERLVRGGVADKVRWTGAVNPQDMPALLRQIDIAVAPYEARDDFYFSPLKVYEYMAAGLAILASDIGQVSAVLNHGHTALLCEPGDVGALAEQLERLILDAPLRHRLGRAAREAAVARHSWDAVARRVFEIARNHVPTRN